MFVENSGAVKTYPYRTSAGRWVLHMDSDQYRAWKYWLHHEIGKNFFPEPTMQAIFEWPPSTQMGADQLAQHISDIRDGDDPYAAKRRDGSRPAIGGAPVPRHPRPWDGYIPDPEPDEKLITRDAMQLIRQRLCPASKRNSEAWVEKEASPT